MTEFSQVTYWRNFLVLLFLTVFLTCYLQKLYNHNVIKKQFLQSYSFSQNRLQHRPRSVKIVAKLTNLPFTKNNIFFVLCLINPNIFGKCEALNYVNWKERIGLQGLPLHAWGKVQFFTPLLIIQLRDFVT